MSDKNNSALKNLDAIIDELGEDLFQMTDEEYLEYKKDQEQITNDASHVRNIFHAADKLFRKKSLSVARENYENEKAVENSCKDKVKRHIKSLRTLLEETLSSDPQLQSGLTFQNRNIEDFTDEDIELAVSQLLELGLIDESVFNKKDHE